MNESDSSDAASSGTTGDCSWTLDDEGVLTISGVGAMQNYSYNSNLPWGKSITSVIIEDGVTQIGDYAFYRCNSLTSVTIPDSVTTIGSDAFDSCTSIIEVVNYSSLDILADTYSNGSIAEYAHFVHTPTSEHPYSPVQSDYRVASVVTIPDSVTSIGRSAFYGCTSLTSIIIPDSVTSIGSIAFNGCISLTSITIPDSVTSIGYGAFSGCTSLTSVTIGNSVTTIGSDAFYGCTSIIEVVNYSSLDIVADTHSNGSITGYAHFVHTPTSEHPYSPVQSDYRVASVVTIPDSVTSIGRYAFSECTSLTSIIIPDSVTSIGSSAFEGCTSLTTIVIPDSVSAISYHTFNGCTSLESIVIKNPETNLDNYAFVDCINLKTIICSISVLENPDAFWITSRGPQKQYSNQPHVTTSVGVYTFTLFGPGVSSMSPESLSVVEVMKDDLPDALREKYSSKYPCFLIKVNGSTELPAGTKLSVGFHKDQWLTKVGICYMDSTGSETISAIIQPNYSGQDSDYDYWFDVDVDHLGYFMYTSAYSSVDIANSEMIALGIAVAGTVIILAVAFLKSRRQENELSAVDNPKIRRFAENIKHRGDKDVIINSFSTIILILFPFILTVLVALFGSKNQTNFALADGNLQMMSIMAEAFVIESFIIMALIFASYTRLHSHSLRDYEWGNSLREALSNMDLECPSLEGKMDKKIFPLIFPISILVVIMIAYSTYMILAMPITYGDNHQDFSWLTLAFFGGVALCIVTYLLTLPAVLSFPARHEREQIEFTQELSEILKTKGIEIPPMCQTIKERSLIVTIVLSIITVGIYAIWSIIKSYSEMNNHIKNQWRYEDELLLTLKSEGLHEFDRNFFFIPNPELSEKQNRYAEKKFNKMTKTKSKVEGSMPAAMVFAELFLAIILLTYILKIIGLSQDLYEAVPWVSAEPWEFTVIISAYADSIKSDINVGKTLGTLAMNLILIFLLTSAILGIASKKPKSWKKVARTCVIFAATTAITALLVSSDSYVNYFTFNPYVTIACTYCILLMVIVSGNVRRFYSVDPHNVAGPLSWARFMLFGKPPEKISEENSSWAQLETVEQE